MNRNAFFKCLAASCLCCAGFAVSAQTAGKYTVGASLLRQQHPFYIELADAMKKQAAKDGVRLDLSIANQDLNKKLWEFEAFIGKKAAPFILRPGTPKG